jgi:hypothetical protein
MRVEAHRHQRGDAADEAIDQHRHAVLGTGQVGAGQRGDLEATDTGQGLQRLVGAQPVQHQRRLDHLGLVPHTALSRPVPGPLSSRAGQLSKVLARAAAAVVPNAHLAADEQLGAVLDRTQGAVATGLQGGGQLGVGHRRLAGEVGRARAEAQVVHAGQFEGRIDGAEVDHLKACELARQHADRRAATDEVAQHLPGHCLRVGRDALLHHTVVAGEIADRDLVHAGLFAPLPAGQ